MHGGERGAGIHFGTISEGTEEWSDLALSLHQSPYKRTGGWQFKPGHKIVIWAKDGAENVHSHSLPLPVAFSLSMYIYVDIHIRFFLSVYVCIYIYIYIYIYICMYAYI